MIGNIKKERRTRRHARIRAKVTGTPERPRLSVHKSNTRITGQIIDDTTATTLVSIATTDVKTGTAGERATAAGKQLAEAAVKKGISAVVFDRGGFIYTGNIKAFADGARSGGLTF